MPRVSQHNLLIHDNTLLVCYNIPYKVQLVLVNTEAELLEIIEANMSEKSIRIISQGKKEEKIVKCPDVISGGGMQAYEKYLDQKQANLLEELEQDKQAFDLEKANNILESMVRKAERKIVQASNEWVLKKVQEDILKYQKVKQYKTKKLLPPTDKKQKKSMKLLDKKLEQLAAKKQVFQTNLEKGVQDRQKMTKLNITFPPKQQSDSSSLLCHHDPNFLH